MAQWGSWGTTNKYMSHNQAVYRSLQSVHSTQCLFLAGKAGRHTQKGTVMLAARGWEAGQNVRQVVRPRPNKYCLGAGRQARTNPAMHNQVRLHKVGNNNQLSSNAKWLAGKAAYSYAIHMASYKQLNKNQMPNQRVIKCG